MREELDDLLHVIGRAMRAARELPGDTWPLRAQLLRCADEAVKAKGLLVTNYRDIQLVDIATPEVK